MPVPTKKSGAHESPANPDHRYPVAAAITGGERRRRPPPRVDSAGRTVGRVGVADVDLEPRILDAAALVLGAVVVTPVAVVVVAVVGVAERDLAGEVVAALDIELARPAAVGAHQLIEVGQVLDRAGDLDLAMVKGQRVRPRRVDVPLPG